MPKLTASGEIFSLGADTGFKEGIVQGNIGGGVHTLFDAEAEFCHGIDLALSAKALAQIQGQLSAIAGITGDAQALATVGVNGKLKLAPDIFDEFGFTLNAKAYAQAAVAGRLALSLSFEALANQAKQQLSGLAYDLFIAFLNEISLEAGVWGKAAFSATIGAHVKVNGSLRKKENVDPGFNIAAAFDAGWGGGTGWDFYAGIRFQNPKRLFMTNVDLITTEIVKTSRVHLAEEMLPLLELLELATPIIFETAYDVGEIALESAADSLDEKSATFVELFLARLQTYLMNKLSELAENLLSQLVDELIEFVFDGMFDRPTLEELKDKVNDLIDTMQEKPMTPENFPVIVSKILAMIEVIGKPYADQWQQPLTLAWTSMATTYALANVVGSVSASGSFLGYSVDVSGEAILLPSHAGVQLLEAEFASYLGQAAPDRLPLADAIGYMLHETNVDELFDAIPQVALIFDLLSEHLDVEPEDIIATGLQGSLQQDFSNTELYIKLKTFLQKSVDDYVLKELMPILYEVLPHTDARLYLDEVVAPSFKITSCFVFDKLDLFVQQTDFTELLSDGFLEGLSTIVYQLFTRNVVVVSDILLLGHVIPNLEKLFIQVEQDIRRGRANPFVDPSIELLQTIFPLGHISPKALKPPTQRLVADMMGAAAAANGQEVWSGTRRKQFRGLMTDLLLSIGAAETDFQKKQGTEDFFRELASCAFIPNVDALWQMNDLCMAILNDEIKIVNSKVVPAISKFFLSVSQATLLQLDVTARELIKQARKAAEAALQAYEQARNEVLEHKKQFDEAAQAQAQNLKDIKTYLKSNNRRSAILKTVKAQGIKNVKNTMKKGPGFKVQPKSWQNAQIKAAVDSFNAAWKLVSPQFDLGLKALGNIANGMGAMIESAVDYSSLSEKLAKKIEKDIKKAVEQAVNKPLPQGISFSIIGKMAANTIMGDNAFKKQLRQAITQKTNKQSAKKKYDVAVSKRDAHHKIQQEKDKAYESLLGENLGVTILQPQPQKIHRHDLALNLAINGANPTFVRNSDRVLLMLNGKRINVPKQSWSYNQTHKQLILKHSLNGQSQILLVGANVLECSVISGNGQQIRKTAVFQYSQI